MNRDTLRKQLIRHEGERLTVYDDATGLPLKPGDTLRGTPTIGVGRNLVAGITHDEAMMLLDHDLQRAEREVRAALPWFFELDDVRQVALCNLAFNMGTAVLLEFREMLAALKAGKNEEAAGHLLDSRYARQVGHRAVEMADALRDGTPPPMWHPV